MSGGTRAIAEAKGTVSPGGDIVYQDRWRFADGHWGEWQTFRTKEWDRYPLPKPEGGVEAQVRIAAAEGPQRWRANNARAL
jgi:hypothetical protein